MTGSYTPENLPPLVADLISQPLVRLNTQGTPYPVLAKSWQVSSDSAKYRVFLNNQLVWGDGTQVKSSDIKLSLPDVDVSYPDENTLEFSLTDSFSPFLSLLTMPIFKDNTFIGLGKYKVTGFKENRGLVTELSLSSSTKQRISGGLPQNIIIRFYPDERTAKTAFSLGEIDSLMGVSSPKEFDNFPQVSLEYIPNYNKIVTIFYNTKDPVLADKNMRRALNCALPVIGGEERAKTSIPPSSWAYSDSVKVCVDDLKAAKADFNKVQSNKDGIIILTTIPQFSSLANTIVQAWQKIGVNVQIRVENGLPQNFQALLISETIPADPDQYILWHSTQTRTNLSRYDTNKRLDKDLEDGRKISDLKIRQEKYADMQKILADDVPASFLYFPKTLVVSRVRVAKEIDNLLRFIVQI